ncbi:uncharacterized protein LOC128995158 [Macrosteles quadrilineatus]|uniref:uncharacterized protein LOC128995158 n=1 Tax=Macrosteles quadrilineatus TaxID=74068 RepID=UPI0023E2C975|nr:uncharacterized protein LOC128995158 [Macrosteles quadrilineatus]
MMWLVLLVAVELVTASDLQLGDRIIATEKECDRILKINENWTTGNYHEETAQYVDLYLICSESLNEDKLKYIEENKMDLSWYPDTFAVETSEGEKFVKKPPPKNIEVLTMDSAKKIMSKYIKEVGEKISPIYKLFDLHSEEGQEIVDKQIECEELALYTFKHPEDEIGEPKHEKCLTELYCMKADFMDKHGLPREQFPEFFPILYKSRGTEIKTPPEFERSVCKSSETTGGSKRELEKWMSGVELIGEKLINMGETGTDFIHRLVNKGKSGESKVLTKEELDKLLENAESVSISDDEDGTEDGTKKKTLQVYGDLLADKLEELQAKGIEIAHSQLGRDIAATGVDAIGNVKGALSVAGDAAKGAALKLKEGGDSFLNKLTKNSLENNKEITTSGTQKDHVEPKTIMDTLLDRVVGPGSASGTDSVKTPSPLQILKELTRGDDGTLSNSEIEKSIKALKKSAEDKMGNLQLSKKEILQSAEIVKDAMGTLLSAAGQGYGVAKDMLPHEIEKAKDLVNQLINYATDEILGENKSIDHEDEDDDNDDSEDGDDEDDKENAAENKQPSKDQEDGGLTEQEPESTPAKNNQGSGQNQQSTNGDKQTSVSNTAEINDNKTTDGGNAMTNSADSKDDRADLSDEEEDKTSAKSVSEEKSVNKNQETTVPKEDKIDIRRRK